MHDNQKIIDEHQYQTMILDACLEIIDNGPSDEMFRVLIDAVGSYMEMVPEYCDVSVPYFVLYVYTNFMEDSLRRIRGFTVHDDRTITSFIYHSTMQEMIKIKRCIGNDRPGQQFPHYNPECKKGGQCKPSPLERYDTSMAPLRNGEEFNRRDTFEDPIVMRKIEDMFRYKE